MRDIVDSGYYSSNAHRLFSWTCGLTGPAMNGLCWNLLNPKFLADACGSDAVDHTLPNMDLPKTNE